MLLWSETQEGISNSTTEAINQGITLSVCFNMAPIASSACGNIGELKQTIVDLKTDEGYIASRGCGFVYPSRLIRFSY